jgi:glycosyltransferase involved in cell wall biosynthesis
MSLLKAFEYMCTGKVTLCVDLQMPREVLADDHNTVLLTPDDTSAWTVLTRSLMHDAERHRRLGKAARPELLAQHTWGARAKRVLTLLSAYGEPILPTIHAIRG